MRTNRSRRVGAGRPLWWQELRRAGLLGAVSAFMLAAMGLLNGAAVTAQTTTTSIPVTVTASSTNPPVGTAVTFFGTVQGQPATGCTDTFYWSFSDGMPGTNQQNGNGFSTIQRTFTTAATVTATLTVVEAPQGATCRSFGQGTTTVTVGGTSTTTGGTGTGTTTGSNSKIEVAPNGPYGGTVGQPISFGGFAQPANGNTATITTYSWNFGDNSTGQGRFVTHTYTTAGTFTVTLTVTDSSGQSSSATTTANVAASTGTSGSGASGGSGGSTTSTSSGVVTANGLTVNPGGPYTGSAGTPVTFTASATTTNSGATVTSYVWSFGDGTSGTGQTTTKTYNTNGTYTVALTVTDSTGAVVTATTTVAITGTGGLRTVSLVPGCNNVSSTFPDNTPTGTLINGISPQSALISVWRLADPAAGRYRGYFPGATQASDLPTINRLDAIFICVTAAATLSEPTI